MPPAATTQAPPPDVLTALRRLRLIEETEQPAFTPLTGGVSSDIWRVDTAGGTWCLKRALAKLKVRQDWRAPVSRSRNEYDWIAIAGRIMPAAAPELAGYDAEAGLIVMRFYEPARYPLWKAELAAGRADPQLAAAVGDAIGCIQAGTAGNPAMAGARASSMPSPCWPWQVAHSLLQKWTISMATCGAGAGCGGFSCANPGSASARRMKGKVKRMR